MKVGYKPNKKKSIGPKRIYKKKRMLNKWRGIR
jgi:hypothetical protein